MDELVQVANNTDPTSDNICDKTLWACQDANFNVLGVIDSSGVLLERYEYTPYGKRTTFFSAGSNDSSLMAPLPTSSHVTDGSTVQPFALCEVGHQGLSHDEESGLVYNRARMLNPALGRFMQRDYGKGYIDGMSLYQYIRSNPIGLQDPMGFKTDCPTCEKQKEAITPDTSPEAIHKDVDRLLEALKEKAKELAQTKLGSAESDAIEEQIGRIDEQLNGIATAQGMTVISGAAIGLATFADCDACRIWYQKTMDDLIDANNGRSNPGECDSIKPSNDTDSHPLTNCKLAIKGAVAGGAGLMTTATADMLVGQLDNLAQAAQDACRCANKKRQK